MQEVKISELKARLSHYVHLVEKGEEVIVKDRNRPIARLTGFSRTEETVPAEPRRVSREEARRIFALLPRPRISRRALEKALHATREERLAPGTRS